MNCKKIELLISLDIDNEINKIEKDILEKHLERCKKCREKREKFVKLKNAINSNKVIKKKYNKNSYKKIIVSGIAALLILILGVIFSTYNFTKTESYTENYYPLSSYFIEDSVQYDYNQPMVSYIIIE